VFIIIKFAFVCSFFTILLILFTSSNNNREFNPNLMPLNQADGSQPKELHTIVERKLLPDDKLIQYTLQKINQDRSELGLPSLKLSKNKAAQIHAEELFQSKYAQPTHLSWNGMKPYMLYSLYGGTNYMEQNVAISGYGNDDLKKCKELRCHNIEPYEQISKVEWSMLHNDTICCNDNHRKNILDRHHTHVSIGIVYSDYYLVLVENFENNYLMLDQQITRDNKNIQIVGRIEPFNSTYTIDRIGIYYDPLPNRLSLEENKSVNSYNLGDLVAIVAKPAPLFEVYEKPANYALLEAKSWYNNNKMMDIRFDLSSVMSRQGVYTVVTYLKDNKLNSFPAGSYSIFI
jgi:Cysteine-rich secretory protein family